MVQIFPRLKASCVCRWKKPICLQTSPSCGIPNFNKFVQMHLVIVHILGIREFQGTWRVPQMQWVSSFLVTWSFVSLFTQQEFWDSLESLNSGTFEDIWASSICSHKTLWVLGRFETLEKSWDSIVLWFADHLGNTWDSAGTSGNF